MKKRLGLLFGGKSAEHEISIKSANAVFNNIDRYKYDISLIYINRKGLFTVLDNDKVFPKNIEKEVYFNFIPWTVNAGKILECDIYFPVLHGPNGEDGKIQALIELSGYPLVGANSLGSTLAMDKAISKHLFKNAGLKTVDFLSYDRNTDTDKIIWEVSGKLKYPLFIKPNSLGSSVGISKAESETELRIGISEAFKYDNRIIIEQGLEVREIEVSVMGNNDIMVSEPGELKPANEFYDYNDKYKDGKTEFDIPAILDKEHKDIITYSAVKAFKTLRLNGMSRVDFFIEKKTKEVYINEINTIPGFTEISMFPKLWETRNISFKDLISRLIEYGFEYHKNFTQ
jgi:D-alanine-D-alanine ligase